MRYVLYISILCFLISCKNSTEEKMADETSKTTEKVSEKTLMEWDDDSLIYPEEKHFKNIRQVTFGGDNAEAYWSFDDSQLVFQSNNSAWGMECDQMFLMNASETFKGDKQPPMISTGN